MKGTAMRACSSSPLLKVLFVLMAGLIITSCAGDESLMDLGQLPKEDYRAGEVLVGLTSGGSVQRSSVQEELLPGARELERFTIGGHPAVGSALRASTGSESAAALEVIRLQLPPDMSVADAVEQLASRTDILYAEPNYRVRRAVVPDDPFFYKQWGLQNAGGTPFTGEWGTFTGPGPDISAPTAWEISRGDGSVIVATIDTGMEYVHPDLAANVWLNAGESGRTDSGYDKKSNGIDDDGNGYVDDWQGWNFSTNNNDPDDDDLDITVIPYQPLGHGSHVAGIIGAVGNNNVGISGVNWDVKLMPLKFFNSTGNGDIANAAKAIDYAVANGARIINASYEVDFLSQTELNAISAARTAGVLFVAAAGNNGDDIDAGKKIYPAAHPLDNIIAVAALNPDGSKAHFSDYGSTSVDLAAPGVYIYSTVRLERTGEDGQTGYDYMSGTSMAAPMVSGAAALVWAKYPDLSAQEVREILLATVDSSAALNDRLASGGSLNLGQALSKEILPPPPTAPSGLAGVGQASGALLTWIDASSDETAFIVERSLDNLSFTEAARLKANTTTYLDSGSPSDGVIVHYRVKSLAMISASAYSNVVDVSLPLHPPDDLHGYADTSGIYLFWNDNSSAETGYSIERRDQGSAVFTEIARSPANNTSYTDTNTLAGTPYLYRVRAYNETLGNSDYSNELLAQREGSGASSSGKSSGCFIATAAFGSAMAPQVGALRALRDHFLLTNAPGQLFVALYYRISPPLADFIADHELLRAGVRTLLRPLVWMAKLVTPGVAEAMGLRSAPALTVSAEADVVAGELLVCFRQELSAAAITTILQHEKSERIEQIDSRQGTLLRIKLPPGVTTAVGQKNFSAYQEVIYAEPNRRVTIRKP